MTEKVTSVQAPSADSILSQAFVTNNTIYVSGQILNTPDGKLVEGTVREKLQQIMTNIANILEEAGSNFYNLDESWSRRSTKSVGNKPVKRQSV